MFKHLFVFESPILKKELRSMLLRPFKKSFKRPLNSIINVFTYLLIMITILYLFVSVLKGFTVYGLKHELLIISVTLAMLVQFLTSLPSISKYLYQNNDYLILQPLPLEPLAILKTKTLVLYLRELLSAAFMVLPILIAYAIFSQFSWYMYLLILVVYLLLPIFPLMLGILLSIPYLKMQKWLKNWRFLRYGLYIVVVGGIFYFYQDILLWVTNLVNSNRLTLIFTESNANTLANLAKWLVPFNWYCGIVTLNNILLNSLLAIGITIVMLVISILVNNYNYEQNAKKAYHNEYHRSTKKINFFKKSKHSLLKKELLMLIRNEEVVFSYVGIMILMPLLSYLMLTVTNDIVVKTFGSLYRLPFLLLFTMIFVGMSNNIASTVVSREKQNIDIMKNMPVSYTKQINVKVLLSSILFILTLIISIGVMLLGNLITLSEALITLVVTLLSGEGLILGSINRDIINPNLKGHLADNNNPNVFIVQAFLLGILYCATTFIFVWAGEATTVANLTNVGIALVILIMAAFKLYQKLPLKVQVSGL